MVRLSICIPTFNFGSFIGETLDSILCQLPADCEVVVVDGASTDDTAAVVTRRACAQLRYVRRDRRGGIDADMAKSVELARGEYCWLFSADDVMRPDAIQRALAVIGGGHDVVVCRHSNCTKTMKHINVHPILMTPGNRCLDFADPQQRIPYLRNAATTEALFSFMSSLVVRREAWCAVDAVDEFMGSCWGHVARLLEVGRKRLRLCVIDEVWLDKRGENDSFMDRGLVHRIAIAVDGFLRISRWFYGANSLEVAEVRRLLRREIGLPLLLNAKRRAASDPITEDPAVLDRLVNELSVGAEIKMRARYEVYRRCPASLCIPALVAYIVVGRARQALTQ